MPSVPIAVDVPPEIEPWIARLIIRWANIEYRLRLLYATALDTDIKKLRITGTKVPADQYWPKILDLIAHQKRDLGINDEQKKDIGKEISTLSTSRDELAHGIWLQIPGSSHPLLQITKGPGPQGQPSAKELPQAKSISVQYLSDLVRRSDALIERLIKLHRANEAAARPAKASVNFSGVAVTAISGQTPYTAYGSASADCIIEATGYVGSLGGDLVQGTIHADVLSITGDNDLPPQVKEQVARVVRDTVFVDKSDGGEDAP